MSGQNDFEVLGITQKSTDAEVRDKYVELARMYHPDNVSTEADPEVPKPTVGAG